MPSWLIAHAAEHVWCRPSEDGRFIIKPQRLSTGRGDVFGVCVSEHNIQLPDQVNWYHTFQIGLQNPEDLGFEVWGGWRKASDLVNRNGIVFIAYDLSGRQIPLDLVYLRFISNHNLVIAVRRYELQINFATSDLYIKLYKGIVQGTGGWTSEHRITCESLVVRAPEDITGFMVRVGQMARKPGKLLCSVNGYPVTGFTLTNVKPWDYVEYIHDGTIKEYHDFYLDDLVDYYSTLDKSKKYLIHLPKAVDEILHLNDLELYLYKDDVGRFVHTHQMADLRQLTHRDFSLASQHLFDYGVRNPEWWDLDADVRLRVYVRAPGLAKGMTYDSHRIQELYKLSDEQIISALVGADSTLPEWQAANLEQSAFSRLINAKPEHITRALVTDAYGYNAASRYLGDNYLPVQSDTDGNRYCELSHLMMQGCTVFEYSASGTLLGYYVHNLYLGPVYTCKHAETAFCEPIEGIGGKDLDIEFGFEMSPVAAEYQYRYYADTTITEQPSWHYTEVTGSNAYDVLADGKVVWHLDPTRYLPVRQSDRRFLINEFEFTTSDVYSGTGLLYFNAEYLCKRDGVVRPLKFDPETVEVWLNGKPLVIGLDVGVTWPYIAIATKQLMNAERDVFNVTLRARGMLPLGTQYTMPTYGFVNNGVLSDNTHFDVRDDKVVRLIAGGRQLGRTQVVCREDIPTVTGVLLPNGTPYQITDPVVPLRNQVEIPTYQLRATAKDLDQRVEAYLTQQLPQPLYGDINPIAKLYVLYSVLMNKLVLDMLNGLLVLTEAPGQPITSVGLEAYMADYLEYLAIDPAYHGVDSRYVAVYPLAANGTAELTPLEFSFIERVNKTYFDNRVILNTQLKVKDRT